MTTLPDPRRILGRLLSFRKVDRTRRRPAPGPVLEPLEGRALLSADGAFASQLTHSAEFYTNIIKADYTKFLGRSPTATDLSYYLNELRNGVSDENLLAGFAGSQEFYNTSGGDNAAWITAMYRDILGRAPSSSDLTYYEQSLNGGNTRTNISLGFARSPEHETQVITNDYGKYLGRSPSQAELNYYVTQYAHGLANEDIIAGFVGSAEFNQIHSPGSPTPVAAAYNFADAAYKTILGRTASAAELTAAENTVLGLPTSAVYNVTATGTIGGTPFSQTGSLGVKPTVTTTGPVVNARDVGLDLGSPGLNGPTGSLGFASNLKLLQLFGLVSDPTTAPALVLAGVKADIPSGTLTVSIGSQAANTSTLYQNEFNLVTNAPTSVILITGGTITLKFAPGGATVTGTISLRGVSLSTSAPTTYVASLSGILM